MLMPCNLVILLFFAVLFKGYSQKPTLIKVHKQSELVYFYQKGIKCDTITKNNYNNFYFILNDSLKLTTQILVNNGRFVATQNDSIIQFIFMPGLIYESKFVKDNAIKPNTNLKLVSLINGATAFDKNTITIQVTSNLHDKPLIENKFYYKH